MARPEAPAKPLILGRIAPPADGVFRVAADTEFDGITTLTTQFAARRGAKIAVQIYRSPLVPEPPADFNLDPLAELVKDHCSGLILRPVKPITRVLSPLRVFRDLHRITPDEVVVRSRVNGDDLRATHSVGNPLVLMMIAHFLPADFYRMFGRSFFATLIQARTERDVKLYVEANKLLAFREAGRNRYADPTLEYALGGTELTPVRVRTFDTALPFGRYKLDDHARTFLGVGKVESITQTDKEHMLQTFQERTADAYLYAALDPVLTLLVEERMREEDRRMYAALGITGSDVPPLRATQGSRVAETIVKSVTGIAAGSVLLSQKGTELKGGGAGRVSASKVKALLAEGSGERMAVEKWSRFGTQTGECHGGLLFSRSPDEFFHESPDQFRDVDLSGCYANIIASMNMYVGRPVVLEPGSGGMTLADAVRFVHKHAAGRDAWIIKVSGKVTTFPNVLIPSTRSAVTSANYRSEGTKRASRRRRYGFVFDWVPDAGRLTGATALYTDVIEAGIVASATWLMVRAMPGPLREEYENLEVDTILFYPKSHVAADGADFDRLSRKYAGTGSGWSSKLDMEAMERVTVEQLGDEYVALKFPIGELAKTITGFRKEAKAKFGKGSGAELGWKQHANSLYGVAASRHLVTNNVVLSNGITATARALAFTMQLSLNGEQVITDGCTYRRDHIPAGTLADCLAADPEYPIRRPSDGVAYLDPSTIPAADKDFTGWYREHAKRFLGVNGPAYDRLFALHELEHKTCGDPPQAAFDAFACDGAGNYLKLVKTEDGWVVVDFKARSFGRKAKEVLAPWIIETYTADNYAGPPPITESTSLISYKEAKTVARTALKMLKAGSGDEPPRVVFPVGIERRTAQAYKMIKPSGFLFRTPAQRAKIVKAMEKFAERYGCGLEAMALRRGYEGRRQGSVRDVAKAVYAFIRGGGENLSKALNLNRPSKELQAVEAGHVKKLHLRRRKLRAKLVRSIDARLLSEEALLTGLMVNEGHQILVE